MRPFLFSRFVHFSSLLRLTGKYSFSHPMKKFLASLFLLLSFMSFAQKGDMPFTVNEKWFFSLDIIRGLVNREPGAAIAYKLNDWTLVELYYGHSFKSFNIIASGGDNGSYVYHPGQGEIVKAGVKLCSDEDMMNDVRYLGLYVMYKHLNIPEYCNRHGSNGMNSILRETVSEQRDIVKLLVNTGGFRFHWDMYFLEWYAGGGVSLRSRMIDKFSWGYGGSCNEFQYPQGKYEHLLKASPAIDVGVRLGITR